MENFNLTQTGQEVQEILDGAAMQTDLTAENERAELAEQTLQGNIDNEALSRQNADGVLQGKIDDEETRAKAAEKQNADDIDAIEEKIPNQASSSNQLADKEYVEDLVSTASATFRGTFNLVSDLHLTIDASRSDIAAALGNAIANADNNDYAFVLIPTSVDTPTEIASIEKYKFNGSVWGFEYVLNNSGFTAAQWAAINSGITSALVTKLGALPTASELATALLAKQDVLTFDSAPTPGSLNPVTSAGIHTAIDTEKGARQNADAALQQAIEAILVLIPSAASALNQLADKAFVNSSIATNTATFRGTFNLVSDLHLALNASHTDVANALANAISSANNNDYCFVQIPTSVDTPTEIRVTERYKFNGTAWAYEYDLNNSGFTAAQWEAINSAITSALVTKLSVLPTASELATELAGKQAVLTFDNQPTSGSSNPVKSGGVYDVVAAINAKIPSDADAANKMTTEARIATIIGALDATFDLTSADGHVTFKMTQTDGLIASVQILTYDIASAAALTTLGGRVSLNESDISNLQAAYAALTQSDIVIVNGALPSSGQQQNIIYRQLDPDHTPPQFYSDYMWNGTTWVLMATYNNAIDPRPKKGSQNLVTSGGVFDNMGALDVSELNATENPHTLAKYADLTSALNALPAEYRKGGMSIKFVQSSDNKYVQYRLMADAWSTTVTDWQGIDDEPIAGSENLIKSSGVATPISKILSTVKRSNNIFYGNWINGDIGNDGKIIPMSSGVNNIVNVNFFEVKPNTTYTYSIGGVVSAGTLYLCEYEDEYTYIGYTNLGSSGQNLSFTTGQSTRYIRFAVFADGASVENMIPINVMICEGTEFLPFEPYYKVDKSALDYDFLKTLFATNERIGEGNGGALNLYSPEYDTISKSIKEQIDSILNIFRTSNNHWVGTWENADLPNGVWVPKNTGVENAANRTFFPVNGGSDYVIGQNPNKKSVLSSVIYIEEYDTSKTFVKETNLGASHQWHTFTTQSSTRYVRFVLYLSGGAFSDIITDEMIFCDGQELIDYITHFVVGVDNIEKNTLLSLLKRDSLFSQTKNIVPDTLVFHNARIDGDGVYHELSSGVSNAAAEEFIEVLAARTYILSSSNNMGLTLYVEEYDSNKNFIQERSYGIVNDNKVLFSVSNQTIYIRLQTYLQDADWNTIYPRNLQIELGGISTEYTKNFGLSTNYIDEVELFNKMTLSGLVPPKYDIPYYYFWNGYLYDKVNRVNALLSDCAGNGTAFFFITDIHWPENAKKSPALIQYLQEKTHINLLINGGDDGNNGHEELPTILRNISGRINIHMVSGNHDLFYPSTGNTIAFQYDMFRTDQVGNTERRYYYVDDIQRKTRYVVLSAYKDGTSSVVVQEGYENEQYEWFVNTALQVQSGWKIIVFTHSFYEIAEQDLSDVYYTNGAQRFVEAIDNYNGNGEIIFAMQGHIHSDRIIVTAENNNVVATTCDKYQKWDQYDIPVVTRELGTRTEQAFDIVVVNYNTRTATFVRIGARALNGVGTNVGTEVEERVINF